jgi:hypothetical protein
MGVIYEHVRYDRELLLHGVKRNEVLELWEVERYGRDSYGDPDYVSIYDQTPAQWFGQGVRLLGRTAVECTRDVLADAIGRDVAAVARGASTEGGRFVIDLFAGSGNTLYWLSRHLPGARALGFELDDAVSALTRSNIAALNLPIALEHVDYDAGLTRVSVPSGDLIVVFVAPPWGDALSETDGLDLRRTSPPVTRIVERVLDRFVNPVLCAVQVMERTGIASLVELEEKFEHSSLHIYGFNDPGANHGVLLGTRNVPTS